jgi:hypothetical protein
MLSCLSKIISVLAIVLLLLSCNKNVEDSSELWKNAQTSGEIIRRSGTVFDTYQNKDVAMADAENRLRTGGGLFGKKAGIGGTFGKKESNNTVSSIGMPINPYLWRGSLETISFMPLSSADPFGGTIITDWYSDGQTINERCKVNIFIKGLELKTSNLKVNTFCQSFENNRWIDLPTSASQSAQLENAILNKAKRIKLAKN